MSKCIRRGKDNGPDHRKLPHPEKPAAQDSLVSPSLEAAIMNAKYVNAVPLYRQEQEFQTVRRCRFPAQNMAQLDHPMCGPISWQCFMIICIEISVRLPCPAGR